MKKFTVDRIEGELAVLECENGSFVNMELDSLPKNIREGDIIRKMQKLMDKLFTEE